MHFFATQCDLSVTFVSRFFVIYVNLCDIDHDMMTGVEYRSRTAAYSRCIYVYNAVSIKYISLDVLLSYIGVCGEQKMFLKVYFLQLLAVVYCIPTALSLKSLMWTPGTLVFC